jgi:hypothetical protein
MLSRESVGLKVRPIREVPPIMKNPWKLVNSAPQSPIFVLPAAAVTMQSLVDREEHSMVFGVQTVDPISDTLNALWVSSPIDLDRYLNGLHDAHAEFLRQLWDAAGPFQ